jgi:hypothetical protein
MIARNDKDWLTARVNGEAFLMNVRGPEVIGLDEVSAEIWSMLETPRSADDVCVSISKLFRVTPEQCRADVERVLDSLKKQGAVD